MSDLEPSSLPPVPDVHLDEPHLTVPGYQPPSLGPLPPLSLGASATGAGVEGAAGGGTTASLMAAFGHLTDPAGPAAPAAPDYFAPIPPPTRPDLQLNGLGPISGAINPWLANPEAVAEDAQRQINMMPPVDPGLAKQETIIHSPTLKF